MRWWELAAVSQQQWPSAQGRRNALAAKFSSAAQVVAFKLGTPITDATWYSRESPSVSVAGAVSVPWPVTFRDPAWWHRLALPPTTATPGCFSPPMVEPASIDCDPTMIRSRCSPADYSRSQAVLALPHRPPQGGRILVQALLTSETRHERERIGSALLELLNESYALPTCKLTVADRAQTHATDETGRLVQKTYGYYRCRIPRPGDAPERCGIRIYHRTAIRQQILAPGAFTTTLIHEWTHHFDFAGLGLGRSPHTRGFYSRVRWTAEALGQPPDDQTAWETAS